MQLPTNLPYGILCILFTHFTQVTAVCPTLPCSENVPVYGVDSVPIYSSTLSSTLLVSTTSHAAMISVTSQTMKSAQEQSTTPVDVSSTSSLSTLGLLSTTASSATPTSTPTRISPAPTLTSTPSAEPIVVSSPRSTTEVPTVTPSSVTAASSNATSPIIQSTTASSVRSVAFNSSASVTVPASITQCGSCRVLADQVQVYYWPTASVKNDCARGVSVSPFETGVPYASNASRIQSLASRVADSPTTTVVDGYTL